MIATKVVFTTPKVRLKQAPVASAQHEATNKRQTHTLATASTVSD
jgi:hypothetical protein